MFASSSIEYWDGTYYYLFALLTVTALVDRILPANQDNLPVKVLSEYFVKD